MLPEREMNIYKLIEICKITKNYRKLIEVGLKLISVRTKNLAIFLEMESPPFQKIKNTYRQVEIISVLYERAYLREMIDNTKIERLKKIEKIYNDNLEDIPFRYITQLYEIYYLLKDVETPKEEVMEREIEPFSFDLDKTLDKRIMVLEGRLKGDFSQEAFSELTQLKLIRDSFKDKEKKQVQIEGPLKDTPHSAEIGRKQGEYFFISLIIISIGIGFFLTAELTLFPYPYLIEVLSFFLFISFGIAALMLILYWKVFMEKPSQETFLNSVFKI